MVDLVLSDVQVTTTATLIIPTTDAPSQPTPAGHPTQPDPDRGGGCWPSPASPGWPTRNAGTDRAAADDPGQHDATTVRPTPSHDPGADRRCGGGPIGTASDPIPSRPVIGRAPPAADPAAGLRLRQPVTAPGSTCWPRSTVRLSCWPGRGPSELPDPPLQGRYSRIVAQAIDADANPHLARDRHGRVWFVPKAAIAAPVGLLLPAQVNAILADPDTIIRLGTANPHTGAVEQLDEQTYRPGAKLARLVRARDGTCRYPGCATPAARCDLDHVIAYPAGPTTAANLQTLCEPITGSSTTAAGPSA